MKRKSGAIILAAGKGKRMRMDSGNKVTATLAAKTLIQHTVNFMQKLGMKTILVVVGHQKESVMTSLRDHDIVFVEQKEQLGTGHAVECAIQELPGDITDVIIAYGDDAVLYAEKNVGIVQNLFTVHSTQNNAVTLLTLEQDNPSGLGRIVRDKSGKILSIVEEKDATEIERKLTEINPGCFIFSADFLRQFLPKLQKSPVTGEYYITSLIDLAITNGQKVDILAGGKILWRGVNTKEELAEAEKLYNRTNAIYEQ